MNGYIPYRSTITAGDELRPPVNIALRIGQNINWFKSIYSLFTGYTQQQYRSANTVTVQTNALSGVNNEVKVPTPNILDYSSKPRANIKG